MGTPNPEDPMAHPVAPFRSRESASPAMPASIFGYVWQTSGRHQIWLGLLATAIFLLTMGPLELQHSAWYVLVNTAARRLKQYNPIRRARRNVAHHYDLSDRLYDLFLDRDRQYSCAYFAAESDSLEKAQANKKRHIASKLMFNRQRLGVLDIGSGWGGLGKLVEKSR